MGGSHTNDVNRQAIISAHRQQGLMSPLAHAYQGTFSHSKPGQQFAADPHQRGGGVWRRLQGGGAAREGIELIQRRFSKPFEAFRGPL